MTQKILYRIANSWEYQRADIEDSVQDFLEALCEKSKSFKNNLLLNEIAEELGKPKSTVQCHVEGCRVKSKIFYRKTTKNSYDKSPLIVI